MKWQLSKMWATVALLAISISSLAYILNETWHISAGTVGPISSYASSSFVQFNKTYGEGHAYSVIQTKDGGFAIAGMGISNMANLIRTDANGNLLWNKTYQNIYNVGAVEQTGDMGYAVLGSSGYNGHRAFAFLKTDSAGNIQWNKTYDIGVDNAASSFVLTSDGGYAIAGSADLSGTGQFDFCLVKTDSAGNIQWNKTYGVYNSNCMVYCFAKTKDGGYALGGFAESAAWLVKTDSTGNAQWNETFSYQGAYVCYAISIIQTNDGGYGLLGWASYGQAGTNSWFVRTDSNDKELWNKTFSQGVALVAASVIQTKDGGYVISGSVNVAGTTGNSRFWLAKTDSSGDMQWNQTYASGSSDAGDTCSCMVMTSDGGYALAGTMSYQKWDPAIDDYVAGSDYWLVKTDSNGVVPEFPSIVVLLAILAIATSTVIVHRKWARNTHLIPL